MIKGLYETHLFVENLERSIDFYSNKMKLEQCRFDNERRIAFFWMGKFMFLGPIEWYVVQIQCSLEQIQWYLGQMHWYLGQIFW